MAIDFPNSPTLNQLYPSPPVSGAPVWKWDGSEWVIASGTGAGTFFQYEYTATAGQTVFSGADANSNTLSYTAGYIEVFVNGFKLNNADYTATNGTSVTLANGAAVGDQVTIVAYASMSLANALTKANNLSDVASAATSRINLATVGKINVQTFTAVGTTPYTPSANLLYATLECVGGGGAGGGVAGSASGMGGGGGGAGGTYSRKTVTAAAIGASQTVTVGAGGATGGSGFTNGGTGGTSSVGTLCTATGGGGGTGANGVASVGGGGTPGAAGTGDISLRGCPGTGGFYSSTTSGAQGYGGNGGPSGGGFGSGALGPFCSGGSAVIGQGGNSYGGGGSGASFCAVAANQAGGAGAPGIVVITEYCSA